MNQELEYRGYIIKPTPNSYEVYDKRGNYLKQTPFKSHGALTDCKHYIDKIIKNLRWH